MFGVSCFAGGMKHGPQKFNKTAAGSATVMLFLATVALVMPAVVDLFASGSLEAHPAAIDRLSFWTSIVLLLVYGAGLNSRPGPSATRCARAPGTNTARTSASVRR